MKMGRKKFRIATVILLIVCMIVLCMQNVKYGNMYNLADEEILADYPEVHHLTSTQQATMELSVERNWGKGRLLLKNQESGEICSVPLENGDTEIGLDTGKYQVFLIGKWFGGNLTLKSDDILFYAE